MNGEGILVNSQLSHFFQTCQKRQQKKNRGEYFLNNPLYHFHTPVKSRVGLDSSSQRLVSWSRACPCRISPPMNPNQPRGPTKLIRTIPKGPNAHARGSPAQLTAVPSQPGRGGTRTRSASRLPPEFPTRQVALAIGDREKARGRVKQ
jgi:hypothetical protein